MNAAHPSAGASEEARGGPSRADGIRVPKRKTIKVFTGKPEGPR